MNARCLKCNQYYGFRASKGNRLSEHSCWCGGKYELISSAKSVTIAIDKIPVGVQMNRVSVLSENMAIVYPYKNRSGQLFLMGENRILIPLNINDDK